MEGVSDAGAPRAPARTCPCRDQLSVPGLRGGARRACDSRWLLAAPTPARLPAPPSGARSPQGVARRRRGAPRPRRGRRVAAGAAAPAAGVPAQAGGRRGAGGAGCGDGQVTSGWGFSATSCRRRSCCPPAALLTNPLLVHHAPTQPLHALQPARPPTPPKQGVEVAELDLLLHVRPCEGLVRQVDGTIEKRFAKAEVTYPMEVRGGGRAGAARGACSGGRWWRAPGAVGCGASGRHIGTPLSSCARASPQPQLCPPALKPLSRLARLATSPLRPPPAAGGAAQPCARPSLPARDRGGGAGRHGVWAGRARAVPGALALRLPGHRAARRGGGAHQEGGRGLGVPWGLGGCELARGGSAGAACWRGRTACEARALPTRPRLASCCPAGPGGGCGRGAGARRVPRVPGAGARQRHHHRASGCAAARRGAPSAWHAGGAEEAAVRSPHGGWCCEPTCLPRPRPPSMPPSSNPPTRPHLHAPPPAPRHAAKRVLGNINVQYSPSGQVARRLGVSHRTLGRMTGAPAWPPGRRAGPPPPPSGSPAGRVCPSWRQPARDGPCRWPLLTTLSPPLSARPPARRRQRVAAGGRGAARPRRRRPVREERRQGAVRPRLCAPAHGGRRGQG